MAFSELERKRYEKAISRFLGARRPPAEWRDPTQTMESPVAKATYVKRAQEWRIYWQRADLAWHRYEPHPSASSLDEFVRVVDTDEYGCFFG